MKNPTSHLCPLPTSVESQSCRRGRAGQALTLEQTPGLQGPPWLLLTTGLGLRSPCRTSEPLGTPCFSAQFLLQAG